MRSRPQSSSIAGHRRRNRIAGQFTALLSPMPRTRKPDLDNLRRGELRRLLHHRGASKVEQFNNIPRGLLRQIEVNNQVEDIMEERVRWSATALGERVRLTFEERVLLGIRTIVCIDRSKKMVRLYYRAQRLERRRERDRRRYREMKAQLPISPRERELLAVLTADRWHDSRGLIEAMKGHYRRESGRPLNKDALAQAVLRAGHKLVEAGLAEQQIAPGPAGGRALFLRRRIAGEVTPFRRRETVTMQRNAANIGVSGL
jgi:hypothetical protein